jgi:hypothetical protein
MKHLKTAQQLNEASENLNISDVSDSFNKNIYVLFDYVNQDVITKGTLKHIKNVLIEMGQDNEWENMDEVYSLNSEEEFRRWVYKNLDCYLQ